MYHLVSQFHIFPAPVQCWVPQEVVLYIHLAAEWACVGRVLSRKFKMDASKVLPPY